MQKLVNTFNISRLNVIYAISSLVLLMSVIWMIWRDYDREWKDVQQEFRDLEIAKAQAKIAEAKIDEKKLADLQTQLQTTEAELDQKRQAATDAEQKLLEAHFEYYRLDKEYKFTKATLDALLYQFREYEHHEDFRAKLVEKEVKNTEESLNRLRIERENAEKQKAEIEGQFNEMAKSRDEIQKEISKLTAERSMQERKLNRIGHNFVNDYFRNQPLVDFMSPSIQVNQIIVDDLYNDLSFLKVSRVDRCTTCHLAIDKKGYEDAPQPFTTHPRLETFLASNSPHPINKIGCTICHRGRDRATSFDFAAHMPDSEEKANAWKEKYGWHEDHYWDFPMFKHEDLEASCLQCHQGVTEVPGAPRVSEGLALMEWAGCHGCHKIDALEGLRKNGPDLFKIATKTNADWTFAWVRDPKGFRPSTSMPKFFDLSNSNSPNDKTRNEVEINAIVSYLFSVSEKNAYPEPSISGDPAKGKELFDAVGCRACHQLGDRKGADYKQKLRMNFGPDLTHIGSKLNAGWAYQWVRDPKSIFPNTRMPNLRLSDEEASHITAYLMSLKDSKPQPARPQSSKRVRDQVALDFLKSQLTVKEAEAKLATMNDEDKDLYLGERLISHYGCTGCHNIKGFENAQRIGTELNNIGAKMVDMLDFGYIKTEHTLKNWLNHKLLDPRVWDTGRLKYMDPRDRLRMPFFGFTEEEVGKIVTVLQGLSQTQLVADGAKKRHSPRELAIENGRRIVKHSNCQGCHELENIGGDIRQLFEDPGFHPPVLNKEGKKVQPEWLFGFLKKPTPIRPWLKTRMPTFGFTDEESTALVHYFNALSNEPYPFKFYDRSAIAHADIKEGEQTFNNYRCIQCHQFGADTGGRSAADLAPNLQMSPKRLKPDWIIDWLLDPQKIQPGTRMPQFWYLDEDSEPEDVEAAKSQIQKVRDYLMTLEENPNQTAMR